MQIKISTNFPEVRKALDRAAKQVLFALAKALTATARSVKAAQGKEMRKVFDRPTAYTQNSLFIKRATKKELQAEVWFKGDGPDDVKERHYISPNIFGGNRPLKRFEQRLVRVGIMQPSERAVPGAGAVLDSYGNMSRGQIIKILSQLQTAAVLGDFSNATNSKRSKAKRAKEAYFVSRGPGSWTGRGAWKNGNKSQHLPRGVWVRRSFGALGTAVKPVLLFVNGANYRPQYKFFELGSRVIAEQFPPHFNAAFEEALKTARFSEPGKLI